MRSSLVFTLILAAACSHDRRGPSGDGGTHDGDQGSIVTGPDGGGCSTTCSADLHQVLDCNGQVLTSCAAGESCAAGSGCVSACDAAGADHDSLGCEFYAPAPPPLAGIGTTCYATFIANTSGTPVTVNVDRAGATLDVTAFGVVPTGSGQAITYAALTGGVIPVDGVAILFLAAADANDCPDGKAAVIGAGFSGTQVGSAFHVTTSAPVVAYDIYPYGGGSGATTSASLLLPTSSWDTTFYAATMPKTYIDAPPWIGFIAAEDDTHVSLRPSVAVVGATGIAGGPAGSSLSYTLQRGQFLKLEQDAELSGSAVVADKPIAVFGGAALTNIPAGVQAADGTHQQIPPVSALGHEYTAVRYRDRLAGTPESPPWSFVGVVDGTVLTYDPPQPGAPTTLAAGQVVRWTTQTPTDPFVVRSQDDAHAFYFAGHMTGCGVIGGDGSPLGCTGDPEWVNAVPPAQFLGRYIFFTDPTYPITNLVFVRQKTNGVFADVTLDCMGTLGGWQAIGSGDYEYTRLDLVNGDFTPQNGCNNGRHVAESSAPFGLTIWGWGSNQSAGFYSAAVSYAYPAGASLRRINDVVITIN